VSRKPCPCNSSCHAVGCETCCDCGASLMGPVEVELRSFKLSGSLMDLSPKAFRTFAGAKRSLGIPNSWLLLWGPGATLVPDVLSEAIEAAEALGL